MEIGASTSTILFPEYVFKKLELDYKDYVVQNPKAFKGSKKTTFTNDSARAVGDYNIGFRAKCLSRGGEVRSFYYKQVRELQRLSIWEVVK